MLPYLFFKLIATQKMAIKIFIGRGRVAYVDTGVTLGLSENWREGMPVMPGERERERVPAN